MTAKVGLTFVLLVLSACAPTDLRYMHSVRMYLPPQCAPEQATRIEPILPREGDTQEMVRAQFGKPGRRDWSISRQEAIWSYKIYLYDCYRVFPPDTVMVGGDTLYMIVHFDREKRVKRVDRVIPG